MISPVVTSLFPILTNAYVKGDRRKLRSFLKKIIVYELAAFVTVSILYWWFGANILFIILKVPKTNTFKLIGFIVVCGTFIWQLAILVQKRFELQLKSFFLLLMVATAFLIQIIFYLVFAKSNNPLLYPLGFLLSSIVYLFLISFSELIVFSKSVWAKSKLLK